MQPSTPAVSAERADLSVDPGADVSGAKQETTYAGVVTRAIGLTIDALLIDVVALVVAGAVLLIFSVFSVSTKNHHAALAVLGSVLFVIWTASYFLVCWTTTGQTPGSRVMQIRVTRTDGTRLRPRHALRRIAGMVLSLPLFWGYFPILTSPRRRGVLDAIAGTVVAVVEAQPDPSVAGRRPARATTDRDRAADGRAPGGRRLNRVRSANGGEP